MSFVFPEKALNKLEEIINTHLETSFPRTFKSPNSASDYCKALRKAGIEPDFYWRISEKLEKVINKKKKDSYSFSLPSRFSSKKIRFTVRRHKNYETGFKLSSLTLPKNHPLAEYSSEKSVYDSDECQVLRSLDTLWAFETPHYIHNKRRAKELVFLACSLGDFKEFSSSGDKVGYISDILKGKNILSLGDDTGSLSEVLASFGAVPVGVEYDETKVKLARTGHFSEDGRPNEYVIQGDIWELVDPSSRLVKKVGGNESFDAMISYGLFNSGSGGETPQNPSAYLAEKLRQYGAELEHDSSAFEERCFTLFMVESEHLLKSPGAQVHTSIDIFPYLSKDIITQSKINILLEDARLVELAHWNICVRKY
jgi:hypothetical protein